SLSEIIGDMYQLAATNDQRDKYKSNDSQIYYGLEYLLFTPVKAGGKQIDRHMHIGASYVCAPEQTNPYHKKAGEFLCDRTGFSHYIAGKNLPKNAYKHRYHQYHQYIGNCFIDRFPHGYFIMVERI